MYKCVARYIMLVLWSLDPQTVAGGAQQGSLPHPLSHRIKVLPTSQLCMCVSHGWEVPKGACPKGTLEFSLNCTGILPEFLGQEHTGNIAKRRLLVNPYGPEIQTEFAVFLGENDLNDEKGFFFYESPPDLYVPSSSLAEFARISLHNFIRILLEFH